MGLFDFLNKIPTINEITGGFGEWLAKVYSKTIPGALMLKFTVILKNQNGITIVTAKTVNSTVVKTSLNAGTQ